MATICCSVQGVQNSVLSSVFQCCKSLKGLMNSVVCFLQQALLLLAPRVRHALVHDSPLCGSIAAEWRTPGTVCRGAAGTSVTV